jgi:hypothetical protein
MIASRDTIIANPAPACPLCRSNQTLADKENQDALPCFMPGVFLLDKENQAALLVLCLASVVFGTG